MLAAHCYYQAGITAYRQRNLELTRELLEKALALQEKAAPESRPYAATLNALGGIANFQGRLDEAQGLFEKALAIREKDAPESADVAAALNNLGSTAWRRGKLDEAQAYLQRSLAIKEKLEPDSLSVAATYNNLGIIARDRSLLRQAQDFHERSLAIKERLAPDSEDAASSYINLGVVASDRGDLRLAESRYLQALAIREELAPDSIDVAAILNNLGNLANSRTNYGAARDFHRRALAIREKVVPDSLDAAESLGNLALAEARGGNASLARDLHLRALGICRRANPNSMEVATSLHNLAILERDAGHPREAEVLLRESLELKLALVPEGQETARGYDMLGLVLHDQGRREEAMESYRAGLELRSRLLPGTLDEAESAYHVGRLLVELNRQEEAFDYLQQAVFALEQQTARLGGTQEDQARFRHQAAQIYEDFIGLSIELDRLPWAYHLLERSRVRVMLSMLAERDLDFSQDIPKELVQEKLTLEEEYRAIQEAGGQGLALDVLQGQLDQHRLKQEQWRKRLERAVPRLAELQAPTPLTLPQAQNLLQPGDLLLAWSVGINRSYCFAVTKQDVQAIALEVSEEELGRQIRRHVQTLSQGDPSSQGAPLTRKLLGPVAGQIAQAERLILMPDGPLHLVPFAALPFGGKGKVLIDHLPLVHMQSMTLLHSLRQEKVSAAPSSVVAVGDPVYTGEAADHTLRLRGVRLSPLPGTRKEVQAIAESFPGGVKTFLGEQATENRVLQNSQADVLHFACHGILDPVLPLSSGLVLSPPGEEGGEDGFLQAWEIFEKVRLKASLVTLSACETGLGEHMGGEGIVGLSRAFQYAGAENVMVSLWSIGDESTAAFMGHFYRALAAGQNKAGALREAQIKLKESEAYAHPFYWAPFILQGPGR